MLFSSPLRHLNPSNLPYTMPLRRGAGHDKTTSKPFHFRFRAIHLLVMLNSFILFRIFHFYFLLTIYKLDVCVIHIL